MERRKFIGTGVRGALATTLLGNLSWAAPISTGRSDSLGSLLPTRPLGTTGEQLTLLAVGGAHLARMDNAFAQKFIERSLEEGIRFFDTAHNYGRGKSEEYLGNYLSPNYRDQVFVMTKSSASTAEEFEKEFYLSLKRLRTDYVDLLLLHSLKNVEDVDTREANGVFDKIREIQGKGHARHIGFSSHTHTSAALHFLKKTASDPFICGGMTPINPVDAAHPDNSFTRDVLPEMIERGHSHLAMKTLGGGSLAGGNMAHKDSGPEQFPIPSKLSFRENFFFVLSQPITAWVSGMESLEQLRFNTEVVRAFSRLSETDKADIIERATGYHSDSNMEVYKVRT